jgi:hypothetical protein
MFLYLEKETRIKNSAKIYFFTANLYFSSHLMAKILAFLPQKILISSNHTIPLQTFRVFPLKTTFFCHFQSKIYMFSYFSRQRFSPQKCFFLPKFGFSRQNLYYPAKIDVFSAKLCISRLNL